MSGNDNLLMQTNMNKIFKTFMLMGIITVSISVCLSYWLGSEYFFLPEWSSESFVVDFVFSIILYVFNVALIMGICLGIYNKSLLKHVAIVFLFYLSGYFAILYFETTQYLILISLYLPLTYSIIAILLHRKNILFRLAITIPFWILYVGYDLLMTPVKYKVITPSLDIVFIQASIMEEFLFSIDVYVILILIYLGLGGVEYAKKFNETLAQNTGLRWINFDAFSDAPLSDAEVKEIATLEAEFETYSTFKQLKVVARFAIIFIGQIFLVLAAFAFIKGIWAALLVILSYFLFGFIIKRRWHSDVVWICTISSVALFSITAFFTIPYNYSLFSVIVSGFLLCMALYYIQRYEADNKARDERLACCTKEKDKLLDNNFKLYDWIRKFTAFKLIKGCDKNRLKHECALRGITGEAEDYLVARFADGLKNPQMCMKFSRSDNSMREYLNRYIEMFNAAAPDGIDIE